MPDNSSLVASAFISSAMSAARIMRVRSQRPVVVRISDGGGIVVEEKRRLHHPELGDARPHGRVVSVIW